MRLPRSFFTLRLVPSLAAVLFAGALSAQAPDDPQASFGSSVSSQGSENGFPAPEQRLTEIDQRIALPSDAADAPTQGESTLLQEIRDTLTRLLSARKNLEMQRAALADIKERSLAFEAEGLETPPPYPLSLSEELRSQLTAAIKAEETTRISMQALDAEVDRATRKLKESAQRRRLTGEEVKGSPTVSHTLRLAELEEESARWSLALAKAQSETATVEKSVKESQRDLLERQVKLAESDIRFSEQDLDDLIATLRTQRDKLDQELEKISKSRPKEEAELAEARRNPNTDPGLLARREAVSRSGVLATEWLEARLDLSSRMEALWRERYRLLNARDGLDEAETAQWRKSATTLEHDLEGELQVLEARQAENRNAMLELEQRLENWDPAWGVKAHAEATLKVLRQQDEQGNAYMADLLAALKLRKRVAEGIATINQEVSWEQRRDALQRVAKRLWNMELWVTPSDRPLTLGHSVKFLASLVGVLLIPWLLLKSLQLAIARRAKRGLGAGETAGNQLNLSAQLVQGTKGFFIIPFALYLAARHLPLASSSMELLRNLVLVTLVAQAAIWGTEFLLHWVDTTKREYQTDPGKVSALGAFSFFGKVIIWAMVLLFALANFGFDISTLVAGLGIGGVAVAFALQNILGDILCSIAILLDEPFQVGDFIIVGEQMGTVTHIGIKTTRLRSLSGEQIIFPNNDLVGSRVHNYKRMLERRVVFKFGVIYDTPREQLAQIPAVVEHIIKGLPRTRFDRAHFFAFGASSLDFEVVYYVLSPDYNTYMDLQQEVNLALVDYFREQGIEFAYPTQVSLVRFSENAPPPLAFGAT